MIKNDPLNGRMIISSRATVRASSGNSIWKLQDQFGGDDEPPPPFFFSFAWILKSGFTRTYYYFLSDDNTAVGIEREKVNDNDGYPIPEAHPGRYYNKSWRGAEYLITTV